MKGFLDIDNQWKDEWQGMPEFVQENQKPFKTYSIHFKSKKDINAFAKLVRQKITSKTKFIWWPKTEKIRRYEKMYVDES